MLRLDNINPLRAEGELRPLARFMGVSYPHVGILSVRLLAKAVEG